MWPTYRSALGRKPVIFVQDTRVMPSASGKKHGLYNQRILPLAQENDIVVLDQRPDEDYLAWLRSIGMGPGQVIHTRQKSVPLAELLRRGSIRTPRVKGLLYVPYFPSRADKRAAKRVGATLVGNPVPAVRYNSKRTFRELCEDIGIAVPYGRVYRRGEIDNLASLLREWVDRSPTGRVLVEGDVGAAGDSLYNNITRRTIRSTCARLSDDANSIFIVEVQEIVQNSPSAVVFIRNDGKTTILGVSDQFLSSAFNHEGNAYPTRSDEHRLLVQARKIASALSMRGVRGYVGMDFIETAAGELLVTEVNPRSTASMYFLGILGMLERRHGPIPCAWSIHVRSKRHLKKKTFAYLREKLRDLLYDGSSVHGKVFVYNLGPLAPRGYFSAILSGENEAGIRRTYQKMLRQLGLDAEEIEQNLRLVR